MAEQHAALEPIAIVGWSCRFPGESSSPSKLWKLLSEPKDVRKSFDQDRLNLMRFYNPNGDTHGATNVSNQGYLLTEDSRLFDPAFFGISPVEADGMDPQQRILLEVVYETFESAGYSLDRIRDSKTSVHVGVMTGDYSDIQMRDTETVLQYCATGTGRSILSNRISYVFDLHGPSVTIDTACSSSLVAVHQAIQAMQTGDCDAAIVGGVNLILDPSMYIIESKLHMLSPDSQSRMWSDDANGYARGEGVAAILLKPLKQALNDGDDVKAVIRATGVNSDGHSQGITMPRASTQAALIRNTYRRAGLDPIQDRPQYFECHGTGTTAGDPVEARAIFEALIEKPGDQDPDDIPQPNAETERQPLFVGSVKTVIGHLEGCAGLAGLMKAVLAIRHRTIPPNILFKQLNPEIQPYYGRIQVPTSALPWPPVPAGEPLRASVNSFGFGGTNAHAIIESYDTNDVQAANKTADHDLVGPFVFSGHTGSSLLGNVKAFLQYLIENSAANLEDLAWVLQCRRSAHRFKSFFVANSRKNLIKRLAKFVAENDDGPKAERASIRPQLVNPAETPGILAVFTGQGAQWPSMGCGLIERSPVFRRSLEQCETVLKSLPDGPEWSLIEELRAGEETSRLAEAELSQPICTAVQIGLVNVLYTAGIRFSAVVGHSSGEIAAVYACGMISLAAAMQIAFYRGKWARLAGSPDGEPGAMMAVGISLEDAENLCALPKFQGQLAVAASNGPQSVTLSGDSKAIKQAKEQFDQQGTFARVLKVDTAYHSHHMQCCTDRYLESLAACDIQVSPPRDDCSWSSSVRGDAELLNRNLEPLKATYWVQNMVQTVLFQQAVKSSIWHGGPFDLTIEIGPHPALKGPTEQTLKSAFGAWPFHIGVLKRGEDDIHALASAIGSCWSYLGPSFVDFEGFRRAFGYDSPSPSAIQDMPSYSWDHTRIYWRESRISKRFRMSQDHSHELLGRRAPDDNDRDMRWRNVFNTIELPWVKGHEVLGQPLLPGASYACLAFEAGKCLAGEKPIRLLEILDLNIRLPVVVPSTKEGIETVFTTHLLETDNPDILEANFAYYYCPDERIGSMVHTCNGRLMIHLGPPMKGQLQPRHSAPHSLLPIDTDHMYQLLHEAGLNYTGIFRRLQQAQRKLDYSLSTATWDVSEFSDSYVAHPAVIDVCFQSLFVASSSPEAGHLPATPLPVHIDRLALDPNVPWANSSGTINLSFESFITKRDGCYLNGDLHIYDTNSGQAILQVETLAVKPVSEPTLEQDKHIFSNVKFHPDPSWRLIEQERITHLDEEETALAQDIERVCLYYIQRLTETVGPSERSGIAWYHQHMFEAFERMLEVVRSGEHPYADPTWLDDRLELIDAIYAEHPGQIDLIACRLIGENMVSVVRGKMQILELLMEDDVLERIYMGACGWFVIIEALVTTMNQLAHKFPRADLLEIGAGTGGTTWTVFQAIFDAIGTYTYTDISTGFFDSAAKKFADYKHKMIFKSLDISNDVESQGYQKGAYDIILATNVLHATAKLDVTLANTRSLLKPGGFLVLVETTGLQVMRTPFVMSGMPGWYLGAEDGRRLHPGIPTHEWDVRLSDTGFSGVDLVFYDAPEYEKHSCSLMVSQAINDTVNQLRDPFSNSRYPPKEGTLLIIGGKTWTVSKLAREIKNLLRTVSDRHIKVATEIEAVNLAKLSGPVDIICLQELDKPVFSSAITDKTLVALQSALSNSQNVLWVTQNRRSGNPRSNMMLGILRTLFQELPQLKTQMLDFDSILDTLSVSRTVAKTFLRFIIYTQHRHDEEKVLWSLESELVVSGHHMFIPRVIPDNEINARYNANWRTITKAQCGDKVATRVVVQREKLALVEDQPAYNLKQGTTAIRVTYSLLVPLGGSNRRYIAVGHEVDTAAAVLVCSEINASIVRVSRESVAHIEEKHVNCVTLEAAGAQIIAQEACSLLSKGDLGVFYNISETLATVVLEEFVRHGKKVLFASSQVSVPLGWIRIHPQSSVRALKALIPRNVALYVDCSNSPSQPTVCPRIVLPSACQTADGGLFQKRLASLYSTVSLTNTYLSIQGHLNAKTPGSLSCKLVDVEELAGCDASIMTRPFITSWNTSKPLNLTLQSANSMDLFDPEKTYLMVGMAGGLGLSICEWALQKGAKNLVITSRNSDISPDWLEAARTLGAHVHVQKMDVTSKASVQEVVDAMRQTLPPVAGVCNAAMVLQDRLFMDMDAESMNKCLQPKVDGTQHLHEVFSTTSLDFFILLGSGATIIGNPGQSNYHAANEFMVALADQRRRQGLAASIIHIGAVIDVGYVTRQSGGVKKAFQSLHIPFISETDVHYAFAEAVIAGRPGSDRCFEIAVGIGRIEKHLDIGELPAWLTDPRCSHLAPLQIVQKKETIIKSSQFNIKKLIEGTQNEGQAISLVQDACCAKLESMMQLTAGTIDIDRSLIDLGIDSLVAVEIRMWFLKEIGTDIPVLKILGGNSVAQICAFAVKQVLAKRAYAAPTLVISAISARSALDTSSEAQSSLDNLKTRDFLEGSPRAPSSSIGDERDPSKLEEKPQSEMDVVPTSGCKNEEKFVAADSIRTVVHEDRMSAAQSRIWALSRLVDPTAYNLAFLFNLTGSLDAIRLRNAMMVTMQHHESLRTCFYSRSEDGQPMQGILPSPVLHFEHIQNATGKDVASAWMAAKTRIWDIENGKTLGVTLLSSGRQDHTIIFAYHHIIMDAVSWRIFLQDLNDAYQMRTLKEPGCTYVDYIHHQLSEVQSGALEIQLQYWLREFVTTPQVLPLLPMAKTQNRPTTPSTKTHFGWREIDKTLSNKIKKSCQATRSTAFHFHLAIIQALFALTLPINEICIGAADANRIDSAYARTVGFFMNLLPLRFQLSKVVRFSQVIQNTSRKVLMALENSAVPFNTLLDHLKIARSSSHTPLFQVAVNYRNGLVQEVPLGSNVMVLTDVQDAKNPYDISFGIVEASQDISMVEVTFQESLFDAEACQKILDIYLRLVETFATNPNCLLKDCEIYDPMDVAKAIELGQGPRVQFDWPLTLSERFVDMCRAYPEKRAIIESSGSITYSEVENRVSSLASALQDAGCFVGTRITVLCEPSADFITSLLAILRIGGVYVPLDISVSSARHEAIIQSCKPTLILCHAATKKASDSLASQYSLRKLSVDRLSESIPIAANTNSSAIPPYTSGSTSTPKGVFANSPAILLYTSGSTGTPKGVLLSQANFVNHVALKTEALGLAQGVESVLQQSSMGFDMSLIQTFCAIANGGSLIIVPHQGRWDPVHITQLILQHNVTLTIATPSEYTTWLLYGSESLTQTKRWRHACLGGEPIRKQLKSDFKRLGMPDLTLTNCYGPTEITAAATFHRVSLESENETAGETIVGKALPNYSVCIVDPEGRPLTVGLSGEICIAGAGVARGYLDAPDITAKRFIPGVGGADRMYRTGDKGRLSPDGTLTLMGRIDGDTQVKLRGIRIELSEVEEALLAASQGSLSSAVVTVYEDVLIAHAVASYGTSLDDDETRQLLQHLPLPQYMRPSQLVFIDRLPMTSNGKVDREEVAKLPLQKISSALHSQDKLSLREAELMLLWKKVLLGKHNLYPDSDFFFVGGNSIRLIKLQHAIREAIGIAIPVHELYQAPTLRRMAAAIDLRRDERGLYDEKIDWEQETALTELILEALNSQIERNDETKDEIEVLLTGATSFLGAAILNALIHDSTVSAIHCAAILPDEQNNLPNAGKVHAYTGNLSLPTLGLSETEVSNLQHRIDVVIHAGANGHCLNNYSSLRASNLYSTRFLATFALPASTPILYLSSNRVTLLTGNAALPPVSVAAFPPPTNGAEGFTAAKWASERLLERLAPHTNALIEIHRPCIVVGDDAPTSDALNAILRYSHLMKAVPIYKNMAGYFDFKAVEEIGRDIAASALRLAKQRTFRLSATTANAEHCVRFRHHSSGIKVSMENIREHLEQHYSCMFDSLEIREWIDRAVEAGLDPLIAIYLESLLDQRKILQFPYLGEIE